MAPMIDMVFLLLVFFMCVSSLSEAGNKVEVDLPKSNVAKVPDDLSGRITVAVKENGDVYLGGREVGKSALRTQLEILVSESFALKLRIRADANTEFSEIREIMRIAAEVGISDVIYATHQMK